MNGIPEILTLALQEHKAGRLDQAKDLYRQILQINPYHADGLHLMGVVISQQGRDDLAIPYIEQALNVKPDVAAFHNNLGFSYQAVAWLDDAAMEYQEALRLQPDFAMAHNNLGNVYRLKGDGEGAARCYRQALHFQPDYPEPNNNLGVVLQEQGKLDEAEACYESALRLNPNHAETHLNRAMLWLLKGNWTTGWTEFEWRWKTKDMPGYHLSQPVWDGSPLDGKTIFSYGEQGLGDTIQFVRYLPLVKARGGRIVFECQPPLVKLLSTFPAIEQLLEREEPRPQFDLHCPLLSLPGIFQTTPSNIPVTDPYLNADAGLVEHWRRELEPIRGFRVGISWQGNKGKPDDQHRSFPLELFAPLAQVPGIQLISLQKGPGADQLRALGGKFPVLDLESRLDEENGAFMDTAAVMKNVDLVISSDTAVPHLAGALGVHVWVVLAMVPDWRWLMDRTDSPWYLNMRLYRQARHRDWQEVFQRITADLKEYSQSPSRNRATISG